MLHIVANTSSRHPFSWSALWRLIFLSEAKPGPKPKVVKQPSDEELALWEAQAICSLWWLR